MNEAANGVSASPKGSSAKQGVMDEDLLRSRISSIQRPDLFPEVKAIDPSVPYAYVDSTEVRQLLLSTALHFMRPEPGKLPSRQDAMEAIELSAHIVTICMSDMYVGAIFEESSKHLRVENPYYRALLDKYVDMTRDEGNAEPDPVGEVG